MSCSLEEKKRSALSAIRKEITKNSGSESNAISVKDNTVRITAGISKKINTKEMAYSTAVDMIARIEKWALEATQNPKFTKGWTTSIDQSAANFVEFKYQFSPLLEKAYEVKYQLPKVDTTSPEAQREIQKGLDFINGISPKLGEHIKSLSGEDKRFYNVNQNEVQYTLKAISLISTNLSKVNSWWKQLGDTEQFWNKVQKDLQIPKEQLTLLKNSEGESIEDRLLDFTSKYSYTVEIKTTKDNKGFTNDNTNFYNQFQADDNYWLYYIADNGEYRRSNEDGDSFIINKDKYDNAFEKEYPNKSKDLYKGETTNSSHYSNLTVPGGTNYTENEISTPLITPSIKGHAQFSTNNGIGWVRSDDKNPIVKGYSENKDAPEEWGLQDSIYNPITKDDKVIFGHPTIGKSYLKKQGNNDFITLDDDYADEVNAFIDANRGKETRQEYKGRKPKEYNQFMLNLFDRLKLQAKKEGKKLFVSNTNILKERMSDFDKVITIPKDEFKKRFDARGATYGFEDWKSDIDATISKVDKSKVISTRGYLSDLLEGNSKTRRILEVQSDLFQKGRDKENLIDSVDKSVLPGLSGRTNIEEYLQGYRYKLEDDGLSDSEIEIKIEEFKKEHFSSILDKKNPQNQFLQLLNKDNNWVTFFIKSIIQDSIKSGYEKVLFPTGNTASKVEGHSTLEDFKKQKEDRIAQLKSKWNVVDDKGNLLSNYKTKEEAEKFSNGRKVISGEEYNSQELQQLKQELERVDREGFGALKPIFNFYEETVTNILKKQGLTPILITDEYGNTWNEIDLQNNNVIEQTKNVQLNVGSTQQFDKIINENLINKLQLAFPSLKIESISQKEADKRGVPKEANSYYEGNKVVIIEGRVSDTILIEEFLHPLINHLFEGNKTLYNSLLAEAKVNYFSVLKRIEREYGVIYKGDQSKIEKEFLTQVIRDNYTKLWKEENKGLFRKLLDRFLSWINKTFNITLNPLKFSNMTIEEFSREIFETNREIKIGELMEEPFFNLGEYDKQLEASLAQKFKTSNNQIDLVGLTDYINTLNYENQAKLRRLFYKEQGDKKDILSDARANASYIIEDTPQVPKDSVLEKSVQSIIDTMYHYGVLTDILKKTYKNLEGLEGTKNKPEISDYFKIFQAAEEIKNTVHGFILTHNGVQSEVIKQAEKTLETLEEIVSKYRNTAIPKIATELAELMVDVNQQAMNNWNIDSERLVKQIDRLKLDPTKNAKEISKLEKELDEIVKDIKKYAITYSTIQDQLLGTKDDKGKLKNEVNLAELFVVSILNTTNPLIHSVVSATKNAITQGVQNSNEDQVALAKLMAQFELNNPKFSKTSPESTFKPFTKIVKILYYDAEGAEQFYEKVVLHTPTNHYEFNNKITQLDQAIKIAKDDTEKDTAKKAKLDFLKLNAEPQFTDEYIRLTGGLSEEAKQKRSSLYEQKNRKLAQRFHKEVLEDTDLAEIEEIQREINMLGSKWDQYGNLKKGPLSDPSSDLAIAESIANNKLKRKELDLYEYEITPNAHASWNELKERVDRGEKIGNFDFSDPIQKDRWYRLNVTRKIPAEFYRVRQEVSNKINALSEKIGKTSEDLAWVQDIKDLWENIFNLDGPYRDQDGVIAGILMTDEATAQVTKWEKDIQEKRRKITNARGLSDEDNARLSRINELLGHQLSIEEKDELLAEKAELLDRMKKNKLSDNDLDLLNDLLAKIDSLQSSEPTTYYQTRYDAEFKAFNPVIDTNEDITSKNAPTIFRDSYVGKKMTARQLSYGNKVGDETIRKEGDKYFKFKYLGEITWNESEKYSYNNYDQGFSESAQLEGVENPLYEQFKDFKDKDGNPIKKHVFTVTEVTEAELDISHEVKKKMFEQTEWFKNNHLLITKWDNETKSHYIEHRPSHCWRETLPKGYSKEEVPSSIWTRTVVKESIVYEGKTVQLLNPNHRAIDGKSTPKLGAGFDNDTYKGFTSQEQDFLKGYTALYVKNQALIPQNQRNGYGLIGIEARTDESLDKIARNFGTNLNKTVLRASSWINRKRGLEVEAQDQNEDFVRDMQNYMKMMFSQNVKPDRISYNFGDNLSLYSEQAHIFEEMYKLLPLILSSTKVINQENKNTAKQLEEWFNSEFLGEKLKGSALMHKIVRKTLGATAKLHLSVSPIRDAKNLVIATIFNGVFVDSRYFTMSQVYNNYKKYYSVLFGGQGLVGSSLHGGVKSPILEKNRYWNVIAGHGVTGSSTGFSATVWRSLWNGEWGMKGTEWTEFLAQTALGHSILDNQQVKLSDGTQKPLNSCYEYNSEGQYVPINFGTKENPVTVKKSEEIRVRGLIERFNQMVNGNHSKINKTGLQRHWTGAILTFYKNHLISGLKDRYYSRAIDYSTGTPVKAIYGRMCALIYNVLRLKGNLEEARTKMSVSDWKRGIQGIREHLALIGVYGAQMIMRAILEGEDDDDITPKAGWNLLNLLNQTNVELLTFNPVDFAVDYYDLVPIIGGSSYEQSKAWDRFQKRNLNQVTVAFARLGDFAEIATYAYETAIGEPSTYKKPKMNNEIGDNKLWTTLFKQSSAYRNIYQKMGYPKEAVKNWEYYKGK